MKHPKDLLVAVLILVLAALPAFGDTRITMEEGTGIVGDGAELPEGMREAYAKREPKTVVYWIAKDRGARIGDSGSMITRLDRRETYVINDQTKSYSVIEMDGSKDSNSASDDSELLLLKTDETRQIGSWKTIRYDMTFDMGEQATAEVVLWVSDGVDVDLSAYKAFGKAMAAQFGADWMLKIHEIDGFPVRQEFKMGSILSWQQLVSVSEEPAPAGTYEPPAGYTRSD